MKKLICLAISLIWIVPLTAQISNTEHNLSVTGPGDIKAVSETEICLFCHFPHSTGNNTYLWNHTLSTASYDFYTSSTMNASTPTSLAGSSIYCMSCHDGTVAIGSVISEGTEIEMSGVDPDGTMPDDEEANMGTDLRDDHPVSIQYEDGLFGSTNEDPNLRDRTDENTVVYGANSLYLENEKVQCGSCHNPHTSTVDHFLEFSNSGSQLCLTCHNI